MSPPGYRSSFAQWETRASVRARPRRHPTAVLGPDQVFFPPELFPVLSAPALSYLDPVARQSILQHALYQYLHFTTVLEQHAVLPVTSAISLGDVGIALPEAMRADAYKITTDEAWHAQFAYDFIAELHAETGVPSSALVRPRFVADLDRLRAGVEPSLRRLADLLFTTVSETLVSQLLMDIPRDGRIPTPIREVVADHAADEGRHQTYFRQFLRELWTQLSAAERRFAGPLIPRLVETFLAPDLGSVEAILRQAGLAPAVISTALRETCSASPEGRLAAEARVTVRLFDEVGALDDHATRAAFTTAGLVSA